MTVRLTPVGTVRGRFVMPDHLTPVPFGVVRLVAGGRVIGQTTTPGSGDNIGDLHSSTTCPWETSASRVRIP